MAKDSPRRLSETTIRVTIFLFLHVLYKGRIRTRKKNQTPSSCRSLVRHLILK